MEPPAPSRGVWSDLRAFFWRRPALPTRIRFQSRAEHQAYSERILQRLGTPVRDYAVLNIHRIGIDAPIRYVFELLLDWNGDSTCWPNHLARVERVEGRVEHIRIFALGRQRPAQGGRRGLFGLTSWPLFHLNALRIQRDPGPMDHHPRPGHRQRPEPLQAALRVAVPQAPGGSVQDPGPRPAGGRPGDPAAPGP